MKVEAGEPLDDADQIFIAALLRGLVKPPSGKQGQKKLSFFRSRVVLAVDLVVKAGLAWSRSDETKEQTSACDAVADALNELGVGARAKTYDSVKKIFRKGRWVLVLDVEQYSD